MIDTPHAVTPTDRRNPPESRAPAHSRSIPEQRKAAGYIAAAIVLVIVAIVAGLGGRGLGGRP